MKIPHRRLHLILWLVLTPLTLLVATVVLLQSPPEPVTDLDRIPHSTNDFPGK